MATGRERLTEKARAAISQYVHLKAEAFMLHDRLVELVLDAERLPRDRLYALLESEGWQWRPEYGNWLKGEPGGGTVRDRQAGWLRARHGEGSRNRE